MLWPAKFPASNFNENAWGVMARRPHSGHYGYNNSYDLI